MAYRYMPMLKTKAGEVTALTNLTASVRARILPVLHIGENPSTNFGTQMAAAWGSQLIAVDGSFNFGHSGSLASFTALVTALRNAGTPAIPSVGYADHPAYVQAVSSVKTDHGLVVKVSLGHLASVFGWITQHGWTLAETDLVIDLRHIASIDHATYSGYVVSLLHQSAQALAACRSVTLASAAAPKDNSSLIHGSNRVSREDWRLWSATYPLSPVQLDYGDYCTGHPDLTEPPGVAMANATVSARYTLDNEWLIIKGRSTSGQYGLPMGVQYTSHAGVIANDPHFGGLPACWADGRVQLAAAGAPGVGSRQKWSEIAANRHISLVADRLP